MTNLLQIIEVPDLEIYLNRKIHHTTTEEDISLRVQRVDIEGINNEQHQEVKEMAE